MFSQYAFLDVGFKFIKLMFLNLNIAKICTSYAHMEYNIVNFLHNA